MRTRSMRTRGGRAGRWLALLAGLVLVSLPALAAAQVADAVIEVVVVDETNQNLPGVTVTATRPDTGYTQNSVTDETGDGAPARPAARHLHREGGVAGLHHRRAGRASRSASARPRGST